MGGSGVAAPPSCDIGARWCGPVVHRRHRTADTAVNDAVTIAGPLPSSSSVASAAGRPTPLAVEIRPRGASGIPAVQYGGARTAAWSGSSGTLARREGKMSQRRGRGRKKRSCTVTEHFRPAAAPMTKQRGIVRAGKCVCVCVVVVEIITLYQVQTGRFLATTGYVAPSPNHVQHNVPMSNSIAVFLNINKKVIPKAQNP